MTEDDDRAFEELFRREHATMLRVAYLLLGSRAAAEEATQDAFAKVYERWRRVENHGGYLRTCVVNRCRNLQRRQRVERRHAASETVGYEELEARELLDALGSLPLKQRAAVVLRFYEGLSEAETADALGIPAGTVKSSVSRALAKLREVVEQ